MMIMIKTSSNWKKQESNDDNEDQKHKNQMMIMTKNIFKLKKKQESNDDNEDQTYDIITTQNDGKTVSLPCIAFEVCGQH